MSRLFHTLVVCGAGLTLVDCGGRSRSESGPAEADDGGSPAAGGSVVTGVSGASSGTASTGTGGTLVIGSAGTASAVAGTSATGGSSSRFPPGAEGQWVCQDEIDFYCNHGTPAGDSVGVFSLNAPCRVDPSRPTSPGDCAPSQSFDCLVGMLAGEMVLFNCQCTSPAQGMCQCPELRTSCASTGSSHYCDGKQTMCGCAMTCILK